MDHCHGKGTIHGNRRTHSHSLGACTENILHLVVIFAINKRTVFIQKVQRLGPISASLTPLWDMWVLALIDAHIRDWRLLCLRTTVQITIMRLIMQSSKSNKVFLPRPAFRVGALETKFVISHKIATSFWWTLQSNLPWEKKKHWRHFCISIWLWIFAPLWKEDHCQSPTKWPPGHWCECLWPKQLDFMRVAWG